MNQLKQNYFTHMLGRIDYYHRYSLRILGRPAKQIFLTHMNEINADLLEELLDQIAAKGWKFTSLTDALEDPLYQLPQDYNKANGVSWFKRIEAHIKETSKSTSTSH